EDVVSEVEEAGVVVVRDCGLAGIMRLLSDPRRRVVTILAHAPLGHVQLGDGVHPAERIAECVPGWSRAVLELAMCASLETGRLIRSFRPALSAIKVSERAVHPD